LASNTKKREGKTVSSLGLLLDLIIVVVFTIIFTIIVGVVVPISRVFYSGRRKRRVDCEVGGLKLV
jgi:hypothetical protein